MEVKGAILPVACKIAGSDLLGLRSAGYECNFRADDKPLNAASCSSSACEQDSGKAALLSL